MAMFKVEDATRSAIIPIIGLVGPTGGGKSCSALSLALGMQQYADGGPIVLIDTENGRSGIYAPPPGQAAEPPKTFAFKRVELPPPFTPLRYRDALLAARGERPSVVIIDQMTAEWRGQGGMLEMVAAEQERPGANKHAAWNKPRTAHYLLMSVLEQLPCPVILTMRAREKTEQVGGQVVDVGWRAVAETDLPYQLTFCFLVGHREPGRLSFDRKVCDQTKMYEGAAGVVSEGELATPEVGKRLAAWAAGEHVEELK